MRPADPERPESAPTRDRPTGAVVVGVVAAGGARAAGSATSVAVGVVGAVAPVGVGVAGW